jgi:PH (Pleckstrin Homology) domain-containing protein
MSYVEQSLAPGEVVRYRTRLHAIVSLGPFTLGVLCAAGAIAALVFGLRARGDGPDGPRAMALLVAALALGVIAGVALVVGTLRRSSTEMAVTTRRVIVKTGILSRHVLELMLSKVESVAVEQGVSGRMLGYGTIVLRGTGGTAERFARVADPLQFRARVQEQIDGAPLPAAPHAGSPAGGAASPFCTHCGARFADAGRFCAQCGAPREADAASTATT